MPCSDYETCDGPENCQHSDCDTTQYYWSEESIAQVKALMIAMSSREFNLSVRQFYIIAESARRKAVVVKSCDCATRESV
jgi:hypothetical protein